MKKLGRKKGYSPTKAEDVPATRSLKMEDAQEEYFLESSSMGNRSESYWRIIMILLFIVLCLMGAVIVCALVPSLLEKPSSSSSKGAINGCQSSHFKIDSTLPKEPTIFQDLTKDEMHAVRDYLLTNTTLNLTKYEDASLAHNFIYLMELYLPPKSDVLLFLNSNGSKPVRRARVVVFNGVKATVEDLLVYPLPRPTRYERLTLRDRSNPVPYSARPFSVLEQRSMLPLVRAATEASYSVLRESFDYWFHNCTTRCLTFLPIGSPGTTERGSRRSWITFLRRVPGYYLHALPFELYIDHTSPDSSKWTIVGVSYGNQYFASVRELVDKYRAKSLLKVRVPPPSQDDIERGWFHRRGKSFMSPPLRPPTIFEPNGKRYSLNGRTIKYAGWDFHIGTRTSAGPAIYNIQFNNTQIAYELSVQEAASQYSAYGAKQSSAQYLDSQGKLGAAFVSMVKGVDCPETATYLAIDNFMDTGSVATTENAICVFEMDMGIPSRRHTEFRFNKQSTGVEGLWYTGGLTDYALVVRAVSTPHNYGFIFDFIFHQNGVIETRTSMAGYLQTTYYEIREQPFGHLNYPSVTGTIHDHFVLYKVDLDIGGRSNSFESLDVVTRNVSYPWERNTFRLKKELNRTTKSVEKEALTRYNFDKPKYYVMKNDNAKNRYGTSRGYRIQPQYMVKQLYDDDYFVTQAAAWTKYQLAVSKYKESERFGSCLYGQYGAAYPICHFDKFFEDNERIENEDLVTWVVVGGLHIPNTEDVPTTITTGNHFTLYLKPYGFLNSDPTMGSSDAVLATVDKSKLKYNVFGTPEAATCKVPDRKFS